MVLAGWVVTGCAPPPSAGSANPPAKPGAKPPARASPSADPFSAAGGSERARPAAFPLFKAHPKLASALPRAVLTELPTPVDSAPRLAAELGVAGIYEKRDDISATPYGGGKPRKLELLLGAALHQDAGTVVTMGGAGSNQAVAVSAYAKRLGLHAVLLLVPQPPSPHVRDNLLADAKYGATLVGVPSQASATRRAAALADAGAYVSPAGGTSPLGNTGFVNAGFELAEQVASGTLPEPDYVYVALGTMGSAVGLAIGLGAAGLETQVVGVRASNVSTSTPAALQAVFTDTVEFLHDLDPTFPRVAFSDDRIVIEAGFLGRGYAYPTTSGKRAMKVYAAHFGRQLEPTYTAKAFAALLARAPEQPQSVHLFWNTHSSQPMDVSDVDAASLPSELRGYFRRR